MRTPVRRASFGFHPASRIASAATRSISDCWGSISLSSLGGIRNWSTRNSSEESRSPENDSSRVPGSPDTSSWIASFPAIGPICAEMPTIAIGDPPRVFPLARCILMEATGGRAPTAARRPSPAHSSMSTWALIPPNPNPLIAARRGRPLAGAGQGSGRLKIRNGLRSNPRAGGASSKFAVGGSTPCLRAIRTLSNPAAPAAVSAWPIFPLTDPITQFPALQPVSPQSDLRLSTSTASPRGVPVAWHSIRSTSRGLQPACS